MPQPENPQPQPPAAATSPAPPGPQAANPEQLPAVGQRWLDVYQIESAITWFDDDKAWIADHAAACEKVLILQVNSIDPLRGSAWDRLHHVKGEDTLGPRDSRLILEKRFEIYQYITAPTLRQWIIDHGKPSPAYLTAWINCLTRAVMALHEQSLAHCRICPDCIYVVQPEEKGIPRLVLGGLERCVRFDRTEMIQFTGDPFYAPPESAGLFRQTPGDPMRAWDWWSVGRVVQELVLGRHILEHIFDHVMPRNGTEEREQAEKLLLEKGHGETKAGGVEVMPAMDKRIDLLLHGLLTGSRDARWGADEMTHWLKGESPNERYRLPRGERLFKWRGKAYTVPEAAEALRTAENWELGPEQLMRKDDPATLISFIRDQPALRIFAQKIEECLAIANAPDLRPFNINLLREVVVALALHRLAGGNLVWKGKRLDSSVMHDFIESDDGKGEHISTVQILCSPPVLGPMEKLDFEAFRVLSEAAKLVAKSVALAIRLKLIEKPDAAEVTRIWAAAFQSPTIWHEVIQKMHETYACSEVPEIQELFTRELPQLEEQLILAWLEPMIPKLKFVTHQEWSKREYGKLQAKGRQLAHALFWQRLGGSLTTGMWWFGRIGFLVGGWGVLTAALALAWPGPFYAPLLILPLMFAAIMRISLRSLVQPLLNQYLPGQARWRLFDGTLRCAAEVQRFPEGRMKRSAISAELDAVNTELANLKFLTPAPTLVRIPPKMLDLRMIALSSWLVLFVPGTFAVMKIHATPNPIDDFKRAWFPKEEELEYYPEPPPYRIEFPFTVPKQMRTVEAYATDTPTEIQTKLGIRRGTSLVGGYVIDTIGADILVRVPSQEPLSFVIYNPARSDLSSKKVYHVRIPPKRNTCVTLDGKNAFVLDY